MSIDEKQFQAFEPDVEQKAFIYQQVHELEEQVKDLEDWLDDFLGD